MLFNPIHSRAFGPVRFAWRNVLRMGRRFGQRFGQCIRQIPQLFMAAVVALFCWLPSWAQAGVLSVGLCRPYKKMVDNELFLMVSVIAAAILVITWKLAPSGTALAKGVGLLAALTLGLNIENVLQATTGVGVAC